MNGYDWVFKKGRSTFKYIGMYAYMIIKYLKEQWPDLIIEVPKQGIVSSEIRDIRFNNIDELFVYRNKESKKDWDRFGATEKNHTNMIHIIEDENKVSIVAGFDDPRWSDDIGKLVRTLNNNNMREDPSKWFTTGTPSTGECKS